MKTRRAVIITFSLLAVGLAPGASGRAFAASPFKDANLEAAIRAEAAIYAISTNTDWVAIDNPDKPTKYHLDPGDKVLQQFADASGGRVFFPYKVDDLAQSFVDIGTELRSQYFIAYSPSNPLANGNYRKIDIEAGRKGLTVRARKGYYAAGNGESPGPSK